MIAITGGIAEGKSTVLGMLSELGFRTASADEIAKEVFQRPEIQEGVATIFGTFDRENIRAAMTMKPELRRELNRIMHGPIWEGILAEIPDFVEIPLLVETCLHIRFRKVWVVTCGPEEQRRRLKARLGSEAPIDALLATQISTRAKAKFADRIVRTNVEPGSVLAFVTAAAVEDRSR